MTESHDDDLLRRLAAADPLDDRSLPTAGDPTPRQLLESIMTDTTDTAPSLDPASDGLDAPAGGKAPILDLPTVAGVDRFSPRRRSRATLLAAVAAVVAIVAGFALFSPGSTEPALAAVHSAAQATADFDSGRVTTTFAVTGADGDGGVETITGTAEAVFSGDDVAVTGEIDGGVEGAPINELPPTVELRLIDGTVYGSDGTTWYALETGGFIGSTAADMIDPRNVLAEVEELLDTTEVGPATVDGIATTHYQSIVDLADSSLRESGWLPTDAPDVDIEGELTVDLFIDGDGLLRRLVVSGGADITEDGESGTATLEVVTTFGDLGADIDIETPTDAVDVMDAETFDLSEELDLEE